MNIAFYIFTHFKYCNFNLFFSEFDSIDFSQNAVFIHSGIKYSLGVDPQSLCGKKLSCPLSTGDDASFTSLVNINDTLPMTWVSNLSIQSYL